MAQSLVSRIGASPLWRAGLASAFILGLAGFAAGVIPQACRNGFVICTTNGPSPELPAAALPTPAVETAAAAEPAQSPTAIGTIDPSMIKRQPASLARNDLIAQTFAALDTELTAAAPAGELTARKVRTVTIGPDGMPVIAASGTDMRVADAEPVPVAEVEPEPVATPEPVVAETDEAPRAVAYAPVRGGTAAVVGGRGANVRSAPQTRGSDVLFALAAGAEVTIVETQKGWHKVVDDRGRSGWIWDELLNR